MTIDYDVTAIGNAILDVISQSDDAFLADAGLVKGSMSLVDADAAARLYERMGPAVETSGGSAANTVAAVAGLGGRAAFIGKVAGDQLGEVFAHDIRAAGVRFTTPPLDGDAPTGRCLILVTPDAQRTMSTFLGAAGELGPEDLDEELIAATRVLYLEGYLWDKQRAKDAFTKAARTASAAGREIAFTLSDAFCVDRHRAEFLSFISAFVDILFANEVELMSLFQSDDFDAALEQVRSRCRIAAVTRSEKGSVIVAGEKTVAVEAAPADVVDTTGAGDAYAAGFLYAYTAGRDLGACAELGGRVAAEVIGHYGPRAEADLKQFV